MLRITPNAARRQYSRALRALLTPSVPLVQVDYGRDFEQQLAFYVQARAAFPNLDGILQAVVHAVCTLIMRTHKIVKGVHTRKTSAFVRVRDVRAVTTMQMGKGF